MGYTGSIGWLESHTLRDDRPKSTWDLTDQFGASFARGFQQIGFDATAAATNTFFGWGASETQSAFMIVLVVAGAFGVFATVRGLTRTRTYAATVAALLIAGPLAYQLFVAGSEAALAGLALIPSLALIGGLAIRNRAPVNIGTFGLLAAGLQTVYPLLIATFVPWVAIVAGLKAVHAALARRVSVRAMAVGLGVLILVTALAIGLSPVAFGRNTTYWHNAATRDYLKTLALPIYSLPAEVIPAYVFQTREFFFLRLSGTSLQEWVLGLVVPGLLVILAAYGIWRYRSAWILLPGIAIAAVLAYYTSVVNECSYCVQRNLLIIGPIAATLIGVGIAAIASASAKVWYRAAAILIAVAVLTIVGHKSSVMARRAEHGSYTFPSDARQPISKLHDRRGPVYLEGIGSTLAAVFETPSLYFAANEATSERLALNAESDDYGGLQYLGSIRRSGPTYVPNYRWILTRLPGIQTNRETVVRQGPFALQKRANSADVTVTSGVVADAAERDPQGLAWVQGRMVFWVSALSPAPLHLELEFKGEAAATTGVARPAQVLSRKPDVLKVCRPVKGSAARRKVFLPLGLQVPPPHPPSDKLGWPAIPTKVLRLAAMSATTGPCANSPARRK
jgi:hypothetical protein